MWKKLKKHTWTVIGVVAGAGGFALGGPLGTAIAAGVVMTARATLSPDKARDIADGAAAGAAGAKAIKEASDALRRK